MKYLPCSIYALTSCLMMYKEIDGGVWVSLIAVVFLMMVRDDIVLDELGVILNEKD